MQTSGVKEERKMGRRRRRGSSLLEEEEEEEEAGWEWERKMRDRAVSTKVLSSMATGERLALRASWRRGYSVFVCWDEKAGRLI